MRVVLDQLLNIRGLWNCAHLGGDAGLHVRRSLAAPADAPGGPEASRAEVPPTAARRYLVERYNWTLLRTGEYGNPPDWRPWLLQMLVWGIISSAEKVLTAAVVIIPLHPHLDAFAR